MKGEVACVNIALDRMMFVTFCCGVSFLMLESLFEEFRQPKFRFVRKLLSHFQLKRND